MGKLKEEDFNMSLSNNLLRNQIIRPYKIEKGNKIYRKLLSIFYLINKKFNYQKKLVD
jgi:hypothetical protein